MESRAASSRPCEPCRELIPPKRVEVLPDTRLRVKRSQTVGGEFELSYVPENLAKAGSLKKNDGSITVKKRRKPVRPKDS